MTRLGILLSGRGSNFLALAERIQTDEIPAEIAVVISNREAAPGILAARERGFTAVTIPSRGMDREAHDAAVITALQQHRVEWVILAGYMRILTADFIRAFPQRILNIHPSLLPAFTGLDAQHQAFDYGVKISGCTVHFVDEHLDHGPIVQQTAVDISMAASGDQAAALILEAEHVIYAEALKRLLTQPWTIAGRRVVFSA